MINKLQYWIELKQCDIIIQKYKQIFTEKQLKNCFQDRTLSYTIDEGDK